MQTVSCMNMQLLKRRQMLVHLPPFFIRIYPVTVPVCVLFYVCRAGR